MSQPVKKVESKSRYGGVCESWVLTECRWGEKAAPEMSPTDSPAPRGGKPGSACHIRSMAPVPYHLGERRKESCFLLSHPSKPRKTRWAQWQWWRLNACPIRRMQWPRTPVFPPSGITPSTTQEGGHSSTPLPNKMQDVAALERYTRAKEETVHHKESKRVRKHKKRFWFALNGICTGAKQETVFCNLNIATWPLTHLAGGVTFIPAGPAFQCQVPEVRSYFFKKSIFRALPNKGNEKSWDILKTGKYILPWLLTQQPVRCACISVQNFMYVLIVHSVEGRNIEGN